MFCRPVIFRLLHCIIDNIQMTEGHTVVSSHSDHGSAMPASWKRKRFKGGRRNQFLAVNREHNFLKKHQECCHIFSDLVGLA
jgi:hypothetical protein